MLDEPTVFLPREGVERLFALVRDAAAAGAAILFVSHDLDEVREITDRVTRPARRRASSARSTTRDDERDACSSR